MNHHHHYENEARNNDHQQHQSNDDDSFTKGNDDVNHRHHEATVTVKDWVAVASNDPNPTTNGINNKVVNTYKVDIEAALFGKLKDDEGLIFKQFLLLQEKEHQHQLQLILKDKEHELMLERKDCELMLERKNHELMLERKNAEIAKKEHELELFNLRYAAFQNDNTTTEVKGKTKYKRITPFDTKISENQEEGQQQHKDDKIDILAETLLQNYLEKMEQKMNENNTIILEKVDDRIKRMKTKIDPNSKSLQVMLQNNPVTFEYDRSLWKTFFVSTWPAMTFGKHKWTIKCSSSSSSYTFPCVGGLITVSDHLQHKEKNASGRIGYHLPCWGYHSLGQFWYDNKIQKEGLPRFSSGDSVTFVLDLGIKAHNENTSTTSDGSNGSLYACVNDGEQHLLVSGLSKFVLSHHGFLPAVSLAACNIHFCDYEFVLEG